jgi:hypothetical protein
MNYLQNRLCERSTWAGFAVLAGILAPRHAPELAQAGDALATLAGLLCALLPEVRK